MQIFYDNFDNVFIMKEDINKWLGEHFSKDRISINDLLATIEDLDSEVECLKEKINLLENKDNEIDDDYIERIRLGI